MRTITVMLNLFQHLIRTIILRARTRFGMTVNHAQSNIVNYGNNKGVALVITLLVLVLLMVIVLEFSSSMRVEARAAANFRDDMNAYYLAKSGVTFAIALLEEDKNNPDTQKVDSLNELWAQKLPPLPVGDGFVSVEIADESSKINVNNLAIPPGTPGKPNTRPLLEQLLEQFDLFQLKEELPDTITDWIDQNVTESPNGAESSYYEGLEEPYEAKDNLLDSLQELRLVKGIDDDIFGKLKNFLTVVPSDGKININTANKEALLSLSAISNQFSESTADDIIKSRAENPFQSDNDLAFGTTGRGLMSDDALREIRNYITLSSNYFSITSTGEVNQNRKKINAIVKREGNKTNIIYWRVE